MKTSHACPAVEKLEDRLCFSATHHVTAAATTIGAADENFILSSAIGNITEVRLGSVALAKTRNVAVHALAVRLLGNHTAAEQQLAQVAIDDGLTLPAGPDYRHRKIIRWMSSLTGKAFDQAFANYMVAGLRQDVGDYQEERKTTADGELQSYIDTQRPLLIRQLGLAKDGQRTAVSENGDGSPA